MCTLVNVAVAADFAYELRFRKKLDLDPACSSLAAAVGLTVISQIAFLCCTYYGILRWEKENDDNATESGRM